MDLNLKVVTLGASNVGKSSIILRYVNDYFEQTKQLTLTASLLTKIIVINGTTVKLQIWDTAGQERFAKCLPMYIRGSNVAFVVIDVSDEKSISRARSDFELLRQYEPQCTKILVVNKIDCVPNVKDDVLQQLALDFSAEIMRTSAKTGQGVQELFEQAAKLHIKLPISQQQDIKSQKAGIVTVEKPKKDGGCC